MPVAPVSAINPVDGFIVPKDDGLALHVPAVDEGGTEKVSVKGGLLLHTVRGYNLPEVGGATTVTLNVAGQGVLPTA